MALIRKPADLEVQTTIKALLYGQPGLGKTTAALSSPTPVLLDFDGGVHRVNTVHQVPTLQVKSYDDFLQVLNGGELTPFQTIVIDTAGKMLDFMGAWLIKNDPKLGQRDGSLSLKGYGSRKAEFLRVLKSISILGKHLVFVAHEREEKEGDQKIVRPEIGGSSAGDLIKELDLVGYMQAIGQNRTISFNPCEKFYGKNTCNLPPFMQIPLLIDEQSNILSANTLLSDIFKSYQDNLERRKETAKTYNTLLEEIDNTINAVTDVTALNSAVSEIGGLNHIWDSAMQSKRKLSDKAKEIGATYDANIKSYVSASA